MAETFGRYFTKCRRRPDGVFRIFARRFRNPLTTGGALRNSPHLDLPTGFAISGEWIAAGRDMN